MYVLTVDVGGTALTTPCEGGAGGSGTHEHDATVCAVHLVTFTPQRQPIFTTVDYLALWGKNVLDNTPDRARLFAYIKQWSPRRVVVDATGLGVGLASALVAAFLMWLSRSR